MTVASKPPLVLIVEDEDNIAAALEYIVRKEGFGYERIATGGGAVERIALSNPRLVLLDIMLPEVSGYEICANLRRAPDMAEMKIIMMTARGSAAERQRSLDLGADGFITKPFDLPTLRQELHRLGGLGSTGSGL